MIWAFAIAYPLALVVGAVIISRRQHRENRRRIMRVESIATDGRDAAHEASATSTQTRAELNRLVEQAKKLGPKRKDI